MKIKQIILLLVRFCLSFLSGYSTMTARKISYAIPKKRRKGKDFESGDSRI